MAQLEQPAGLGRKLAILGVAGSALLAALNVATGLAAGSTSVVAAGFEFAGDVLTSFIVYLGMRMAARPPDEDHPYGHGRFEILAGLLVGLVLVLAGAAICVRSLDQVGAEHPPPRIAAVWVLAISLVVKSALAISKFHTGRKIGSVALVADAWNDSVDLLSCIAALGAVGLAIHDPQRFLAADHYGGFAVGIIVVITGLRIVRDASIELTDTMPSGEVLATIRNLAREIAGVDGVEKCFARKTGLQYHVDLHIEVDPTLTVAQSHYIAHKVQEHVIRELPSVAGVLVHIEPKPGLPASWHQPSD